ncbi:hypothetical protein BLSTO_06513 [Blastocystis sp. subtype 1]
MWASKLEGEGAAMYDCCEAMGKAMLKRAFRATQRLLRERVLLVGHDRWDGGLLTTVLEMCLGGDCGCVMEATTENSVMEFLFNEELGLVVEVDDAKVGEVLAAYEAAQVPACVIAKTQAANRVKVSVNGAVVLKEDGEVKMDRSIGRRCCRG